MDEAFRIVAVWGTAVACVFTAGIASVAAARASMDTAWMLADSSPSLRSLGPAYRRSPATSHATSDLRWPASLFLRPNGLPDGYPSALGRPVLLPFGWFHVLWAGFLGRVLVWLTRRHALAWLVFLPVPLELYHANVHLVLAAVCVLGFRFPALWSIALLTKVTPGVGLLWFLVRREWRSLGIALGATAAFVLISLLVAPGAWPDWIHFLISSAGGPTEDNKPYLAYIPPLWLCLPASALLVVWGARTERRWVLPVSMTLALPVRWITGPAILTAVPRLLPSAKRGVELQAAQPRTRAPAA